MANPQDTASRRTQSSPRGVCRISLHRLHLVRHFGVVRISVAALLLSFRISRGLQPPKSVQWIDWGFSPGFSLPPWQPQCTPSSINQFVIARCICINLCNNKSASTAPQRALHLTLLENEKRNVSVSDMVTLVCAVLASMAFGVLLAYGICQAVFALFRMHALRSPAPSQVHVPSRATAVEG